MNDRSRYTFSISAVVSLVVFDTKFVNFFVTGITRTL